MNNERTIAKLEEMKGRVYVYLATEDVWKKFVHNAELEGFRFGEYKPTEVDYADIVSIYKN